MEKSWEHKSKAFFTFIDLKKAYDSVPSEAMWIALAKLGVPEDTVQPIKSFHRDMKARVMCIDGAMLEEIEVVSGLRQGCCMAPVLFNLYSCLAVERWLARIENIEGAGNTIKYKNNNYSGGTLASYRNCCEKKSTECQFSDGTAILTSTRSGTERAPVEYQQASNDLGLTVSIKISKHMVTGRLVVESDHEPITLEGGDITMVEEFSYLGSLIASSGRVTVDVDRRVPQASKADNKEKDL